MPLSDLSDPTAVEAALDEFDELGREAFLAKYDSSPARASFVSRNGRRYDAKAIAAAAHGYQFGEALNPATFVGGASTVAPKLRSLGFTVVGPDRQPPPGLVAGRVYTWERLGRHFGFEPEYLNRVGGMAPRPRHGSVLLITHPGGARSIDYGDYWEGEELIYTGRGMYGDQKREGANRDVGDNARRLLVFEPAGSRKLRFLGEAECVQEWIAIAPDAVGEQRRVLRFRLRFGGSGPWRSAGRRRVSQPTRRADLERKPRPYRKNRPMREWRSAGPPTAPDESLALQEKATRAHQVLLDSLATWLEATGWRNLEDIHVAIDLRATKADGSRVIFETKTGAASAESARTRAAIGQLLEYRFYYGAEDDRLCVVTDAPISDKRCRLLDRLGIAVLWLDGDRFAAGSRTAADLFAG